MLKYHQVPQLFSKMESRHCQTP